MNKGDIKKFLKYLNERLGINEEIFSNYCFDTDGERISIFTAGIMDKNLGGLRIKSIGLRAGKYFKDRRNDKTKIKISTNFAQIFGRYADKNVVKLSDAEVEKYIRGYDIDKNLDVEDGEILLKWGENIIGTGNYAHNRIKNQIPKQRRI